MITGTKKREKNCGARSRRCEKIFIIELSSSCTIYVKSIFPFQGHFRLQNNATSEQENSRIGQFFELRDKKRRLNHHKIFQHKRNKI